MQQHTKVAGPEKFERAAIDASTRLPVVLFYGSAVFWLLAGTVFALLASFKMNSPQFLDAWGWLTFGRVRPAHLNAMAYGWASSAAIGTGLWIMARLCRTPLQHRKLLTGAAIFWNIGVLLGVLGILSGDGRAIEWLEFPDYASVMLFVAFGLIAVWAILMFRFRAPGHVYVSQWYLLAAFLWFPWMYSTANLLLGFEPIQGGAQGAVNWWYGHNILGLWFTPVGLAAAYYLIPKVLGRPIHSYYLAIVGFWTLAILYSWNGMHHLIGGPLPAWMVSASVVTSVLMLIPVVTTAINFHATVRGHYDALKWSPTLRFTVFGAICYTLVSLQGILMSIPSLNVITHFTHYTVGHAHLGMYAFFTMIMFGAMYYVLPRVVGWEWPSARLIRWHFWLVAVGIGMMVIVLTIGGLIQGAGLLDPQVAFMDVVANTKPWLLLRSVSGILLTAGHIVFAVSFTLLLLKAGARRTEPTLFRPDEPHRTEARDA